MYIIYINYYVYYVTASCSHIAMSRPQLFHSIAPDQLIAINMQQIPMLISKGSAQEFLSGT